MKYFITGGAGFIGSTLVDRLICNKNDKITVFDNFISGKLPYIDKHSKNNNFKIIKGDLLDLSLVKESIKDHDFVFHFAANPDISKAMTETDLDLRLGIIATYNLLEAMRLNNIKKIAYTSGSGVYGDVGFTETKEDFGPLLPISLYGACKLGSEAIISAFCHMFDMQSWIFRLANIVGKTQTHGVCFDFIKKLKNNPKELPILGNGSQSKSYIHVSDVLDAMFFLINNTNEIVSVYNVATDDYITVKEIAEIVIKEINLKDVSLKFANEKRGWKGDIPIVRFNLEKIHELGWKAKYSSKEALTKSVREMLGKD